MSAVSRGALRDLRLLAEAGQEGVAGGTKRTAGTLDMAKSVLSGFSHGESASQSGKGDGKSAGENVATLGLLQAAGLRHNVTKWQAKTKKTAAIVLEKQKVNEKYKKPPRPPLKPLDLWWKRALTFSYTCDFIALLWFLFLAFVFLPSIDPRDLSIAMDPLAWNMSFGATAIFVGFKNVQTLLNIFTWFKIWLAFTIFLTLGLFYGAVMYWRYIYFGDFPCFRGGLHDSMLGFCADGMILISLTSACLYNCGTCFFLYYWRQYKLQRLKEEGRLTHVKTVDELLDAVDSLQTQSAKAPGAIAGEAVEARRRLQSAKTLPEDKELQKPLLDEPKVQALPLRASVLRQQNSAHLSPDAPTLGFSSNTRVGPTQPYISIRMTKSQIFGKNAPVEGA